MTSLTLSLAQRTAYLIGAAVAIGAAGLLWDLGTSRSLPVLGSLPLLPVTVVAAVIGWFLNAFVTARGVAPDSPTRVSAGRVVSLVGLGAFLAIPPMAIDLAIGFPRDLNLPVPDALFFYPSIALVAEVQFHLLPLAVLSLPFQQRSAPGWVVLPVIMVEPFFQVAYLTGPHMLSLLVVLNVSLISAAQLWLYRRHGFLAMIGLRWAFYLFWHIVWGEARLSLLF